MSLFSYRNFIHKKYYQQVIYTLNVYAEASCGCMLKVWISFPRMGLVSFLDNKFLEILSFIFVGP